jgi:hypothetical protein
MQSLPSNLIGGGDPGKPRRRWIPVSAGTMWSRLRCGMHSVRGSEEKDMWMMRLKEQSQFLRSGAESGSTNSGCVMRDAKACGGATSGPRDLRRVSKASRSIGGADVGLPTTTVCLRTGFARQPLMVLSRWGSPVAGPAGRQAYPRHPALAVAGTKPIQHRRLSLDLSRMGAVSRRNIARPAAYGFLLSPSHGIVYDSPKKGN